MRNKELRIFKTLIFELHNKTSYTVRKIVFKRLLQIVQEILDLPIEELSLAIFSPKQMQRINRVYRGKDEPTDVLAFDYGEIVLCPAYIKRKYQIKAKQEVMQKMGELFMHGLAHIAGYTHSSPRREREMKEFEEKILRRCYEDNAKIKNQNDNLKCKNF